VIDVVFSYIHHFAIAAIVPLRELDSNSELPLLADSSQVQLHLKRGAAPMAASQNWTEASDPERK
jgi:hypothetical protein